MKIGINACFHGVSPADELAAMASMVHVVRAPISSIVQAEAIYAGCQAAGLTVLFLIETINDALLGDFATWAVNKNDNAIGIELGNELDLTTITGALFGAWVGRSYQTLRQAGFGGSIYSGACCIGHPNTIQWLTDAIRVGHWSDDLKVAFHRYPLSPWTQNPDQPQNGYSHREEELASLASAVAPSVGTRVLACTEYGYHYDNQTWPWGWFFNHHITDWSWSWHRQLDAQQGADFMAKDLAYFAKFGVELACLYQWSDGLTNTAIDRFGVRMGSTGLSLRTPAVATLMQWSSKS